MALQNRENEVLSNNKNDNQDKNR